MRADVDDLEVMQSPSLRSSPVLTPLPTSLSLSLCLLETVSCSPGCPETWPGTADLPASFPGFRGYSVYYCKSPPPPVVKHSRPQETQTSILHVRVWFGASRHTGSFLIPLLPSIRGSLRGWYLLQRNWGHSPGVSVTHLTSWGCFLKWLEWVLSFELSPETEG